jgi:hypothetical protein
MADGCPLLGHPPAKEHELEEFPEVPYDRSLLTDAEVVGFGALDRHNK